MTVRGQGGHGTCWEAACHWEDLTWRGHADLGFKRTGCDGVTWRGDFHSPSQAYPPVMQRRDQHPRTGLAGGLTRQMVQRVPAT